MDRLGLYTRSPSIPEGKLNTPHQQQPHGMSAGERIAVVLQW